MTPIGALTDRDTLVRTFPAAFRNRVNDVAVTDWHVNSYNGAGGYGDTHQTYDIAECEIFIEFGDGDYETIYANGDLLAQIKGQDYVDALCDDHLADHPLD